MTLAKRATDVLVGRRQVREVEDSVLAAFQFSAL